MQWSNTCLEFSLKFLTNIISCLISLSSLQCKRLGPPLERECRLAARANSCIQIESSTQLFTLVCSYFSYVAYHSQRRLGFELGAVRVGFFSGQIGNGTGFCLRTLRFFPAIIIPPLIVLISFMQNQRYVILALIPSFNSTLIFFSWGIPVVYVTMK